MSPGRIIPINLSSGDDIRRMERESIREWILHAADEHKVFDGRQVLDYGCGRQPYREIIEEAGGAYYGFDRTAFGGSTVTEDVGNLDDVLSTEWGAIVCTQIVQYVAEPRELLNFFLELLEPGGTLTITWPTCWDEIESADLWRFTQQGGLKLLADAGFGAVTSTRRAEVSISGFRFCLGHGAIAWK
jgi:hypothetical protein